MSVDFTKLNRSELIDLICEYQHREVDYCRRIDQLERELAAKHLQSGDSEGVILKATRLHQSLKDAQEILENFMEDMDQREMSYVRKLAEEELDSVEDSQKKVVLPGEEEEFDPDMMREISAATYDIDLSPISEEEAEEDKISAR